VAQNNQKNTKRPFVLLIAAMHRASLIFRSLCETAINYFYLTRDEKVPLSSSSNTGSQKSKDFRYDETGRGLACGKYTVIST